MRYISFWKTNVNGANIYSIQCSLELDQNLEWFSISKTTKKKKKDSVSHPEVLSDSRDRSPRRIRDANSENVVEKSTAGLKGKTVQSFYQVYLRMWLVPSVS